MSTDLFKTSLLVFSVLLLVSASSAISEDLNPEKAEELDHVQQDNFKEDNSNLFSFLSQMSFVDLRSDQYSPGDYVDIDVEVEMTEDTSTEDITRIVEFYKCNNSDCSDPVQDEFLEADRQPLWSEISNHFVLEEGQTPGWDLIYTAPDEDGYYAAVAYKYNVETESVVSTSPEESFVVGNPDDGSDSSETDIDLSLSKSPSYSVDEEAGSVTGTLGIQNTGDTDMAQSDIVEMQVRPEGSNPLSFVGSQSVCDSTEPNNVNKEYSIDSGDSQEISLTADDLDFGESYTVYFLTRNDCYPDNDKVDPIYNSYNSGTFTLGDSETGGDDTTGSAEVVEQARPQVSYEDGTVTGEVSFKNEGGAMSESHIVEMQVRPQGSSPLSAFSQGTNVCDSDYPENVHKTFQLDAGESASATLSTNDIDPEKEYSVYFLTRDECGPDNDRVEPYTYSAFGGNVENESVDTGSGAGGMTVIQILLISIGVGALAVVGYRQL